MTAVADHMSSRDYEREAEASRHRLAGGLRELSDRLSPGTIVDEVLGYAKGGGGTVLTAFSNAARDNPMPSLLIGAGLLMFLSEKTGLGHAMRSHGENSYHRGYRASNSNGHADRGDFSNGRAHGIGDAVSGAAHSVSGAAHAMADGVRNVSGDAMEGVRQGAAGIGAAFAGAADAARSGVMGAAGAARSGAASAAESARSALTGAAGTADQLMHGARDFGGAVNQAGLAIGERIAGTAREAPRKVGDSVTHARDSVMSLISEQPLVAGAVGLAIGAFLAAALPKTEAEDELMGEASDTVKRAVGEIAVDEMEVAKSVAVSLASEVTRMAEEHGMSTEGAVAAVHAATDKLAKAVLPEEIGGQEKSATIADERETGDQRSEP